MTQFIRYTSGNLSDSVRPDWDEYFTDMCRAVAKRADCTRRQVGAVLTYNNRVISTGYNGAPSGQPGCLTQGACPRGKLTYEQQPADVGYSNCTAIHAEVNALLYALDFAHVFEDCVLYCTDKPCEDCTQFIENRKIGTVIYARAV